MAHRSVTHFLHAPSRQATHSYPEIAMLSIIPICCCFISACNAYVVSSSAAHSASQHAVSITSSTLQIPAGQSVQFVATVAGDAGLPLTWAVNGVTGGSSAFGKISTTGLYASPPTAASGQHFNVSAAMQADPNQSATAIVTIQNTIAINPDSATLDVGETQRFTAAINGSSNSRVLWTVAGVLGGNDTLGTVSTDGVYIAPPRLPPAKLSVSTIDPSDSHTTATASITILSVAVVEAHNQWLDGVPEAAASYGCRSITVQQQESESMPEVLDRFASVATEGSCLVLWPISTDPSSLRYSLAWGGRLNEKDILYISDVSQSRIWNSVEVAGD